MHSDELMYREELDVACTVRSSNLAQEIGMVSNVFSDKTGTLTRNEMKLVKFNLNGTNYDIPGTAESVEGKGEAPKATPSFNASHIMEQFGKNKAQFYEFCRCLITCHTVVREKSGNYRAESPDELALVQGVEPYNCRLIERGSKDMIVELFGEKVTYEVLAVNPFNSDRKRMSVLIREPSTNKYFVMCKGADNMMMPLCRLSNEQKNQLNQSLDDLATYGLRTLVIASKEISQEAATKWLAQYKAATISGANREENMAAVGGELEKEMNCIGITAIEDRLQDEVPEVIADLAKAGIVLWMLTGDKLETAINIGRSCNLIVHGTELIYLTKITSSDEFALKLNEVYTDILNKDHNNIALVIDGPSFACFNDRDLDQRAKMLRVGQGCRSVIACRYTPTQKRELVRLVKKDTVPKATCLSIGDGANDVAMILEADVGVGIFGKEGRQAANNADFAIGEFKFLRRLLLVHGRWNYVRQSKTFLYSMHKNMVITLTLFWYTYFTAVSGTSLYESWVYSSFNIVLGLPIIFFGYLDRDLTSQFVLKYPQVSSSSY
jgi:phospholipid-translocating P-type ATPase (flippase)